MKPRLARTGQDLLWQHIYPVNWILFATIRLSQKFPLCHGKKVSIMKYNEKKVIVYVHSICRFDVEYLWLESAKKCVKRI